MINNIKKKFKELILVLKNPIISVLPSQLAFSFVLTIISLFAIIGFLALLLSISTNTLVNFVVKTFPANSSNYLIPIIKGQRFDSSMIFVLGSAVFLSTNGSFAIIQASNLLYDVTNSSSFRNRIKSFVVTIMFIILILFLLLVPGFGTNIMTLLNNMGFLSNFLKIAFKIAQYPLSFLFIFFIIKLIYTTAPSMKLKSSSVTSGSLFTTITWILLTIIYSFYANNFAKMSILYGSLSNLIFLFIWIYFLSYFFVIGMAINVKNNEVITNEAKN